MKKTLSQKIKLRRETLRPMTREQERAAEGGYSGYASVCPTCALSLVPQSCTC